MDEKYVKVDDIVEYCTTYSACLQNKGQSVTQAALRRVKEFAKENATDVQPVNQWISVEDRLPDDCIEVLVHDADCGIIIGWYDKKDNVFAAEFISQLDAVTHWMPLPEPPKDGDAE